MAKARMLHRKISVSIQVNKLSLPARLLFTWMIAHADDEGRLKGDAESIKASVVPMTKWSFAKVKTYLEEIKKQGLIYFWQQNEEWFVEFVKWNEYQQIRKDRFEPSTLPSFLKANANQMSTNCQPDDNQKDPQSNLIESNQIEINKSEDNIKEVIADKNSFKRVSSSINPDNFQPQNPEELAAWETWRKLEPLNKFAFHSTYLKAYKKGLPVAMFYQFMSEIKQDPAIKNPGAVFNKKVADYFSQKAVNYDE